VIPEMGAHTKEDFLLLGALLIIMLCEGDDVSRTNRPWETRACRQLYAITNEAEPPVTKACFYGPGGAGSRHVGRNTFMMPLGNGTGEGEGEAATAWPPRSQGTADDFMKALEGFKKRSDAPTSDECLSRRGTPDDYRYFVHASAANEKNLAPTERRICLEHPVIMDAGRRVIYITNLKAGCSTIGDKLMSASEPTVRICGGLVTPRVLGPMEESLCDNRRACNISCAQSFGWRSHGAKMTEMLNACDLPDRVIDKFLVFTFVRSPFLRAESSYHEAIVAKYDFESVMSHPELMMNSHFRVQSETIGAVSSSGRPLRVDFVGHIESIDLDWGRLSVALQPEVSHLTPAERLALIPSRSEIRKQQAASGGDAHVKNARPGAPHTDRQPTPKHFPDVIGKPFTNNLVINICRSYLQDMICFGYAIPQVCIDHADVVYWPPPKP